MFKLRTTDWSVLFFIKDQYYIQSEWQDTDQLKFVFYRLTPRSKTYFLIFLYEEFMMYKGLYNCQYSIQFKKNLFLCIQATHRINNKDLLSNLLTSARQLPSSHDMQLYLVRMFKDYIKRLLLQLFLFRDRNLTIFYEILNCNKDFKDCICTCLTHRKNVSLVSNESRNCLFNTALSA